MTLSPKWKRRADWMDEMPWQKITVVLGCAAFVVALVILGFLYVIVELTNLFTDSTHKLDLDPFKLVFGFSTAWAGAGAIWNVGKRATTNPEVMKVEAAIRENGGEFRTMADER